MGDDAAPTRSGVVDVLLSDGSICAIRPVVAADEAALVALHEQIGTESTRLRFFSADRAAGPAYARHVATSPDVLALVAVRKGAVVALATAEPCEAGAAEIAFVVADESRGLGIGSLLLEHLAAAGRAVGIRHFVAEVLTDNHRMLDVLRDVGFRHETHSIAGSITVEMDTSMSEEAQRAADERECRSERRSLAPLLAPRSVAVVGARRDGTGVGAAVLRSLVAGGFTGTLHVVHPAATSIQGVACVPRLPVLTGGVDLAVVAVPVERVADTVRDAAQAGCRGVVIVTSGFAEMGEEGLMLQRLLLRIARDGTMRVIGPNCLGLLNTDPDIRLNATFSGSVPEPGGLALASQSGGVGIVLGELTRELGVGVRHLVSLGNKIDVSGNDLLAAWRDDPSVTAAGLYLESFGNAPKFARFAREFSERKPLLAVAGGRSSSGRRAGLSHTAAAASPAVGVRALFAQAGVIECASAEEVADCALFLQREPRPHGRRVAILSNAGGMGVLAADTAEDLGLSVPPLSGGLRAAVSAHVAGTAGLSNPVDAGAGATSDSLGKLADTLLGSDEVDALLVLVVATGASDGAAAIGSLEHARAAHPQKPVLLASFGDLPPAPHTLTTYRTAQSALRALALAARYEQWRSEPHRPDPPGDPERGHRARAVAARLLAGGTDRRLDAAEATELLEVYGLVPSGLLVAGGEAAVAAAQATGYPVVVKSGAREVAHRTEGGLVHVGLGDDAAVRSAVSMLESALGPATPIVVQPVVSGLEVTFGIVRDQRFGPLVRVGAGGTATEVWADDLFLIPPVTRRDAARAIRSLRMWPLLQGYRGAPGGDVAGLEDLLVRVSRLADEVPLVAELDLNPVIAAPGACHLVDVKVRLDPRVAIDAGIPRRL